jgi:hypothetical protein
MSGSRQLKLLLGSTYAKAISANLRDNSSTQLDRGASITIEFAPANAPKLRFWSLSPEPVARARWAVARLDCG